MSFILCRTRMNERQMYMDRFRVDKRGEWRDPIAPYSGLNLPYQFEDEALAEKYATRAYEEDPSWRYEIREYLK